MSQEAAAGADELQRSVQEASFNAAVQNEITLYANTGDGRYVWRLIALYHEARRALPWEVVAKLAAWGDKIQGLTTPAAIAEALELKGSSKHKRGPSNAAAYRKRWRLASEVDLVRRLFPGIKTLKAAFKVVAANRGLSVPVVKRAYHDVFTATQTQPAADASTVIQDLLQTWR